MKRIIITAAAFFALTASLSAQTRTAEEYLKRYQDLTARVGLDGAGIEPLLGRWESDYPEDVNMLEAKYVYYFSSCRSSEVVKLDKTKYLGNAPVLSLKDSLGTPQNYFEVFSYDDELYGKADAAIEKAARLAPERLDLRLVRITTMVAYEKESPDMALSALKQLIDYNYISKPKWNYSGEKVDNELFCSFIQDYCVAFHSIGSPASRQAFREVSEKMSGYNPKSTVFLNNLASSAMISKDYKGALKYINKVLKLDKTDNTAIQNGILLARTTKDVKLEKKYLEMMAKYGATEIDRKGAETRLQTMK